MLRSNSVFRHQSAIRRKFSKLPMDGILVPKHVGVGTLHELCFILFYFVYFVG